MNEIFKKLALVGDVWVLWILVAASIASLGVMIDRWRLFWQSRAEFGALLESLTTALERGDIMAARKVTREHKSVEARVALAGLTHSVLGLAAMENAMSARWISERSLLEKNLMVLGTLGNNAPFIGLFGTVLGIIKAFNDLALAGGSGANVVMSGISSALIATAFGIFVAIPAVAANNYFYARLRRIGSNCQTLIHSLQVQRHKESPVQAMINPVLS